ncbi:conserved membrane hypothetical protein [Candidatus Sulfopaludibacter sp. SbA3]|nr:conserved membrane hypothetical protein [Candidatus Sulfopaludibacter sp. SbA3]
MRGLAVVIMIQCHTFNSYARLDIRDGGPYVLSQFVGGMAAPLFLFMAGMTMAFQMDSLERREPALLRRWLISLKRAGYILLLAFLFRFSNWLLSFPKGTMQEMLKVDILNCMAAALMALSALAVFDARNRARYALAAGLAIAALAPVMSNLNWAGKPALLQEYLVPVAAHNRFPFFPCAAYSAFGLAVGTIVKRTPEERFERVMQWSVLIGLGLILVAQYLSNIPYSIYPKSDFWLNNPTLILIRVGVSLLMMAGAYLWTDYAAGPAWSWMQCLGKNSLMVYWVHVMMVYGILSAPIKRAMSAWQAALATALVVVLMVWLSARWMTWKQRQATGHLTTDAANSQSPTDSKAPSLLRRVWGSARP